MNNKGTCIQWSRDKGMGTLDMDNGEMEDNKETKMGSENGEFVTVPPL